MSVICGWALSKPVTRPPLARSTHTYSPPAAVVVVGQMARGSRISGVFEKAYKDAGHVGKILILLSFPEYEFEYHKMSVSSCLAIFASI